MVRQYLLPARNENKTEHAAETERKWPGYYCTRNPVVVVLTLSIRPKNTIEIRAIIIERVKISFFARRHADGQTESDSDSLTDKTAAQQCNSDLSCSS